MLDWTVKGRTRFKATSYSIECAVQSRFETESFGLSRQVPLGREIFEGPKLDRSYIMTRSLMRSCECIAEIPTLFKRSFHVPPAPDATWKERKRMRAK